MELKKLISLGLVVGTLTSFTFAFNSYQSKDGLIRQGIDNLKELALQYRTDYMELKAQYDEMIGSLESTQDALAQARLKLEQIYMKITGSAWDVANGDILDFDFDSIIPDGEQFENNVDGNAIAELLGLPAGSTTSEILVAIQDLIATVQTLESRIAVLEADIAEYESEQNYLVEQLMALQVKLEEAQDEANAIIDGASDEEQAQLDYLNSTLVELGGEAVGEPEQSNPEVTDPEQSEPTMTLEEAEAAVRAEFAKDTKWNSYANNLLNGTFRLVMQNNKCVITDNLNNTIRAENSTSDADIAVYNAWVTWNNLYQAQLNS